MITVQGYNLIIFLLSKKIETCFVTTISETQAIMTETQATMTETQETMPEPLENMTETQETMPEPPATMTEPSATMTEPPATMTEPSATMTETQATMTEPLENMPAPPATMTEPSATMTETPAPLFPGYLFVDKSHIILHMSLKEVNELIFKAFKALNIQMRKPKDNESKHPYEWYCTYENKNEYEFMLSIAIFATENGHLVELRRLGGSGLNPRLIFSDIIEKINKHLDIKIPGGGLREWSTPLPLPKGWETQSSLGANSE